MEPFLKHTAEVLTEKHGSNLSQCCIVFPNRRSGLFFRKYLSEITAVPIWSPEITTINELMRDLSGLQLADNLTLIFELYHIYKKHKKSVDTFDDFYFWGEMILNDFDDVDKYLIDAKDLFQNLASLKEIKERFSYLSEEQLEAIQTFWKSFNPDKFSKHQADFVQIWSVLFDVYNDFNKYLTENRIAYEGKIYKDVADKISKKEGLALVHSKYIFIGLNALNPCEEKLFENLFNLKQAEFYWDYDEYYVSNKFHEAGFFLRENIKKYPQREGVFSLDHFIKDKKNIEFIACSSDVSQSKIVGEILPGFTNEEKLDADKVAIVLADEHLLVPVLYAIPENIADINVTMGYPIKNTPVFSLLDKLIELQNNIRVLKSGEVKFYYKNVLPVLKHQYVNPFLPTGNNFVNDIVKHNKIYISGEELTTCQITELLFVKVNDTSEVSDYFLNILHAVSVAFDNKDEQEKHKSLPDQEYIYHAVAEIKRLNDIIEDKRIDLSLQIYWRLLRRKLQNVRIPFAGEPLVGLQVMGVLETRTLDFENLIILSMNEGIFPRTDIASSFIPYNLRRGFGLPTMEYQDAIYAYYFYRLIQRAKNISLVYNDNTEGLKTGEASRYLKQLKYESGFKIREKSLTFNVNTSQAKEIRIEKSDKILKKLNNYVETSSDERYFSPSALNTYLTCSLKFYFKYLARFTEAEEVNEEVDAALFGNLLHYVMEQIFDPFKGKMVQKEELIKLEANNVYLEQIIKKAFQSEYFHSSIQKIELTGRNIIIQEVLKKYVKRILKIDQQYAPFSILGLEDYYSVNFPIVVKGKEMKVRLGGKIDRVDKLGDKVRIIDYKTGKVEFSFSGISSLFGEDRKKQNGAAFQTLLYALLYDGNNSEDCITPGLYVTKELFKDQFSFVLKQNKMSINNYQDVASEYAENLTMLLQEIFNPEVEFIQVDDIEVCKNCPYVAICKKQQ